jgi:hypothetical protein
MFEVLFLLALVVALLTDVTPETKIVAPAPPDDLNLN